MIMVCVVCLAFTNTVFHSIALKSFFPLRVTLCTTSVCVSTLAPTSSLVVHLASELGKGGHDAM